MFCLELVIFVMLNRVTMAAVSNPFDISNRTRICLRVAENEVYQPAFAPKKDFCDGWFCWQSQLRLSSKMKILRIMNRFRNDQATNISNMHKLAWHWTLEQEAIRASRTCKRRFLEEYDELRSIEGLGSNLHCENGCLREAMTQNPTQKYFIQVLPKLLLNNSLEDFDSDGNYRRANAMYFGCALVVRNTITKAGQYEDVYHFVCVFCTSDREMKTTFRTEPNDTNCHVPAVRGVDRKYPNLCSVSARRSVHMCPPFELCPVDEIENLAIWHMRDPGTVIELAMVETQTGPLLVVNEEIIGPLDNEGNPSSYSSRMFLDTYGEYLRILAVYPQLPAYVYHYNDRDLERLARAVANLTNGTVKVMRPKITEPAVIYEPLEAIEGSLDAWCCIYVFAMSFIPTIVLALLICYTICSL